MHEDFILELLSFIAIQCSTSEKFIQEAANSQIQENFHPQKYSPEEIIYLLNMCCPCMTACEHIVAIYKIR